MLKIFFLLAITVSMTIAQNQKWRYQECNFQAGGNGVQINDFYIESPIIHPGKTYYKLSAYNNVDINSVINGTVTMRRTVSGLTANVVCTILPLSDSLSVSIGTCTYPDLCDLAYTLLGVKEDPSQCPEYLLAEGLDCTCPFKTEAGQDLYLEDTIDVVDLKPYGVAWLVSGDFYVNVKASHQGKALVCMDIWSSIKPAF